MKNYRKNTNAESAQQEISALGEQDETLNNHVTPCKGCKHYAFRVVTKPPIHFTSWGCLKKKVRFGSNREAEQVDWPKTCRYRE